MIEAAVKAGAFQTSYRRAGRGSTVLLLLSGADQPFGELLFATLAEQFRTIAPAMPPALKSAEWLFDAWLSSFSDGLGLERPAMVAGAVHTAALQSFASRDPERLGPLVLLQRGSLSTIEHEAIQAVDVHVGGSPLRVITVPRPEDQAGRALALAQIVEFLNRPN